ncbi:lysozyme inhibitor LprI family protein [Chelatococcus sp. GCM10030263]|uniref:lysozyme inhibitor LprI family protein n=1 Tax=Chelatococcus sp. GCM10030263 TaxID=3273387 RepID=UPI00360AE540
MTRWLFLVSAILGFTASGAGSSAQAASFDCAKAKAADEIAVCKLPELSELDTKMAALWFAYSKFPFLMGANGARQDEADAFLRQRSACGNEVACLKRVYQARISQLEDGITRAMNDVRRQSGSVGPGSLLPAGIEARVADYGDQCRKLGGTMTGSNQPLMLSGDIDRDGKPDYVLNPINLRCSAAATAFCGNGGCQISIALSSNEYTKPVTALGGEPTLAQRPSGTELDLWVDRLNCKSADFKQACWATYAWKDGKLSESYSARPISAN